jgi:cytochrome bd-type quinol oxidase subunit 1
MDTARANQRIDDVAAGMRDAVLNWPARVSGQIAAEIGRDPHLVQTILQEQMNALLLDVAEQLDLTSPH